MNSVMWFEIPFDESKRAQKFYKDVFDWQINEIPEMDYSMVMTTESDPQTMQPKNPGAINGGIFKKDQTGTTPIVVIGVPSIDEHLKKIEEAGGKIIMPKITFGQMGIYARVSDTEGNIIGIWQSLEQ